MVHAQHAPSSTVRRDQPGTAVLAADRVRGEFLREQERLAHAAAAAKETPSAAQLQELYPELLPSLKQQLLGLGVYLVPDAQPAYTNLRFDGQDETQPSSVAMEFVVRGDRDQRQRMRLKFSRESGSPGLLLQTVSSAGNRIVTLTEFAQLHPEQARTFTAHMPLDGTPRFWKTWSLFGARHDGHFGMYEHVIFNAHGLADGLSASHEFGVGDRPELHMYGPIPERLSVYDPSGQRTRKSDPDVIRELKFPDVPAGS